MFIHIALDPIMITEDARKGQELKRAGNNGNRLHKNSNIKQKAVRTRNSNSEQHHRTHLQPMLPSTSFARAYRTGNHLRRLLTTRHKEFNAV
jgi:hypothetical protein